MGRSNVCWRRSNSKRVTGPFESRFDMTSPYLQRPKRSLSQALEDTGRTPNEMGMREANSSLTGRLSKGPLRLSRNRIAIAMAVGMALLAGTAFVALRSENQQPVATTEPEELNAIVPAAGPSDNGSSEGPAANIEGWGDAPALTPPVGTTLDPND